MLTALRVQNLAIIDQLEVEFGAGLNVVTGETGAGKSILLKAIECLAGNRVSPELVRKSLNSAEVEGLFLIGQHDRELLVEYEEELGDSFGDDELLIRRVIDASGRSKLYLNGKLSTAAIIQRIAPCLFDMTGQHQQQILVDPGKHRQLLDRFGVSTELLAQVAEAYHEFSRHARALASFEKESTAKQHFYERLQAEREELRQVVLREGEKEELQRELQRLTSIELLSSASAQALELIEGEGESITRQFALVRAGLDRAAQQDSRLSGVVELLDTARVNVDEAKLELEEYSSRLEAEPERLDFVQARIAELSRLERKFGKSCDSLIPYLSEIDDELASFEAGEFDAEKLKKRHDEAQATLRQLESSLTKERKAAAKKIGHVVEKALAEVNMAKAKFAVEISDGPSSNAGADHVQFLLTTNPGHPLLPLAKIASGGELSRLLLILKSLLNEGTGASTQIFDEIDAGIGGRVAHIVGEKLKRVAQVSQVISVTHAPQIAALADRHYVVSKESTQNATRAQIRLLSTEERIAEIARMLAGKQVTKEFEDSARELLGLR